MADNETKSDPHFGQGCGVDAPHKELIMCPELMCGACGRSRPAVKYRLIQLDADEPLTLDWLKSVGFKPGDHQFDDIFQIMRLGPVQFSSWSGIGNWQYRTTALWYQPKTRGDIYELERCRALGFKLERQVHDTQP